MTPLKVSPDRLLGSLVTMKHMPVTQGLWLHANTMLKVWVYLFINQERQL